MSTGNRPPPLPQVLCQVLLSGSFYRVSPHDDGEVVEVDLPRLQQQQAEPVHGCGVLQQVRQQMREDGMEQDVNLPEGGGVVFLYVIS